MNTAKLKHKTFEWIFPDSLSDVLLMIFIKIKYQWDFIMGKPRDSTLRFPWPTSVLKRTAIAYLVYSTQTGIRLNRGHYVKSHPFRNTLLLKLWIPQRYIGGLKNALKSTSLKCCTYMGKPCGSTLRFPWPTSVLKRTAIAYLVYSTQTGIRLNRGHYVKSHPFRNTLLLKLWIPQRYIGGLKNALKSTSLKCCTYMN